MIHHEAARDQRLATIIGDHAYREFREPLAVLRRQIATEEFATVAAAAKAFQGRSSRPQVIVLAQAYPGRMSPAGVEQLYRLSPLSRIVALLGSWCEGEPRTGRPWPGVKRIYWHRWTEQMTRRLLCEERRTGWSLPRTATDDERLEFELHSLPTRRLGLVAIVTQTAESFQSLADALQTFGYSTGWWKSDCLGDLRRPTIVLWEGDVGQPGAAAAIQQLKRSAGAAPVVALLNFPRWEDRCRALQAGAAAIISKPFLLPDLSGAIDEALRTSGWAADAA